jgi:hypothetical protein
MPLERRDSPSSFSSSSSTKKYVDKYRRARYPLHQRINTLLRREIAGSGAAAATGEKSTNIAEGHAA